MAEYAIFIDDIAGIDLAKVDSGVAIAAMRAINKTADWGRTLSAREMRRQVNFPGSYLQGDTSRLKVSQRATKDRLEGVISGRRRPTSLARFVSGSARRGVPIQVQVKPGQARLMKRAFLMKLRAGDTGRLGNMGLAVRVAKGSKPQNAYKPLKIADGLYLLYGPSVDQVFKDVREQVSKPVSTYLVNEFNRLLDLKL